jgi:transcriptional regulator with XRE-family HTH domain
MDEAAFRRTVSKNIAAYRKAHRDTQMDLAAKLNYSDKSVSKWERGESLPDVFILAQIADLYQVTVSNLIGEVEPPKESQPHYHLFVLILSVALVFTIAAVLFVAFTLARVDFRAWLFFIYAVPAAAVVCVVFTCLWWRILWQGIAISVLIWSAGLCIYLSLPIPNLSLIFIICAALQVMIALWELFRKYKRK